jgi:hypothetical protein
MQTRRSLFAPVGVAALAAVLAGGLVACGQGTTATDAADSPGPTEQESPTQQESPSVEPTVGTYPDYPFADYDYTLRVSCYCPDAGEPMRISVRDGKVVDAVFLRKGWDHQAGDPVENTWRHLTLADVIAAANDTEADDVQVRWRDGQDYPRSVWVDKSRMAADEEVGYDVSHVLPVG